MRITDNFRCLRNLVYPFYMKAVIQELMVKGRITAIEKSSGIYLEVNSEDSVCYLKHLRHSNESSNMEMVQYFLKRKYDSKEQK